MTHFVTTASEEFEQLASGELSFWIMKEKYPVQTSDRIIFQETDSEDNFTGKELEKQVSVIWADSGLKNNFVAFNFKY